MKVFKNNKLWYIVRENEYHTFRTWGEVIVYLKETMNFLSGNG